MKPAQFVLITGDDWQGLYFNGTLVDEGHSIRFRDVMEAIEANGGRVTAWAQVECDIDWLTDRGDLPKTIAECELTHPIPDGLIYS